jgi:outer membrane immunogenic protein
VKKLGANMRRQIAAALLSGSLLGLASAASAADLPVKARPLPPPVPVFSWTGFYVGAHLGGAWGTAEATATSATACEVLPGICPQVFAASGFSIPVAQIQTNGFLGGIQGGYNWQFNNWAVLGVEAQFSWTDLKGTSPCVLVFGCTAEHDWITTLALRWGVTYDRLLLYVKGGVAWSKATYSATLNLDGLASASTSVSDTRTGWMFGTGLEYAFWGNWSAKIEYNYIDFRSKDYDFPITVDLFLINVGTSIHEKVHLIKAGINYRFDWGKAPVIARY